MDYYTNQEPISSTHAWKQLKQHAKNDRSKLLLSELLKDQTRSQNFLVSHNHLYLDFTHQNVNQNTMNMLFELAKQAKVMEKIQKMAKGDRINMTEHRSVLHMALRSSGPEQRFIVDGFNLSEQVHKVLNKIERFSKDIFEGNYRTHFPNKLVNIVVIGIGGSYLGSEFVYEALLYDKKASKMAEGRQIRFLANVDPVAVSRALYGLNPRETIAIIISKTFTTAETMLNARTVRDWFIDKIGTDKMGPHMIAVSSNLQKCREFGISENCVFEMWDWVGGRYSVCSAVGVLPLSLVFGFDVVKDFLSGARDIDENFLNSNPEKNLPLIMGLIGVWNSSFLEYSAHAIIPYSESLRRFPAHIQQLDMESNGKRVSCDGSVLDFQTGEIVFGEPGTNAQHSFFQLLHQGRVVPIDFIGLCKSQKPIHSESESVSNHDELMSNFFAQPDALAIGRSESSLLSNPKALHPSIVPHKVFPGNRPSLSLLLPELNAFTTGQLLALYEHRVAVQGFIWGINSFDQFGVELGKELGKNIRTLISSLRIEDKAFDESNTFISASGYDLLKKFIDESKN